MGYFEEINSVQDLANKAIMYKIEEDPEPQSDDNSEPEPEPEPDKNPEK